MAFALSFQLWKREMKAILIRIISEKNEQGDRLDPPRCEFFSPKKLDETVLKSPVSVHHHIPLRYWDLPCSIFQDTRNPLKKEEMEKEDDEVEKLEKKKKELEEEVKTKKSKTDVNKEI